MQPKSRAFTAHHDSGLARVIITPIMIISPITKNGIQVNAIWDTGATGTCITHKVVQQLGLVATGKANVNTANGPAIQSSYIVNGILPNQVQIEGINVLELPALSDGCEVLIGMDIISLGDFSVCNFGGKTVVSFRVPSLHSIDYVKNPDHIWPQDPNMPAAKNSVLYKPKQSANEVCKCGSGKKYKRCCGKVA